MAYRCPRCGKDVQRNSVGFFPGGAVGALIMSAFAGFRCLDCGPIPRSEFTPEERSQMTLSSVGFVVGAIVLLVAVVALIVYLNS